MINPDAQINMLRSYLTSKGLDYNQVDTIADSANMDINNAILDVVTEAVEQAVNYALDIGAEEFLSDMDLLNIGGSFQIVTKSGRTDYSVDEREMLPHLLKNAKIAKDGSRYKHIPMRPSHSKVQGRSIFEDQRALQSKIDTARANIKNELNGSRMSATAVAQRFMNSVMINTPQRSKYTNRSSGAVSFRTASSKQNPKNDWVLPKKERDMTGFLVDINRNIEHSIDENIRYIIKEYEAIV